MPTLRVFSGRPTACLPQISTPSLYCLNQSNGPKHRYDKLEKRRRTTQAGDEKSGHINAGPNEGIFFLDSMSPTREPEKLSESDLESRCIPTPTQLHPGLSIFQCRKALPAHLGSLSESHCKHRPCGLDRTSHTANPPNQGA